MQQFIKHRIFYWVIILVGIVYIASLSEEVDHHKYNEQSLRGSIQALLSKLDMYYDINH